MTVSVRQPTYWPQNRPTLQLKLSPPSIRPIHAIHTLTEQQAGAVASAMALLPGIWTLDRHETPEGDLYLVLTEEPSGHSVIVERTTAGIVLSTLCDDVLLPDPWVHAGIETVVTGLRRICAAVTEPARRHSA